MTNSLRNSLSIYTIPTNKVKKAVSSMGSYGKKGMSVNTSRKFLKQMCLYLVFEWHKTPKIISTKKLNIDKPIPDPRTKNALIKSSSLIPTATGVNDFLFLIKH